MKTRLNLLIIVFLIFNISAIAQEQIQLEGNVVDEEGEPVPFAQVALYEDSDNKTPLKGTVTNAEGDFQISAREGTYDLAIVFVGYDKKILENVEFSAAGSKLGEIVIQEAAQKLEEVVIESEQVRRPITTDLEGLNVRPDQTLSNIGGSVLDVLRNTPSVSVSQDGSISLRGSSSTNILIDGRNSALASDLEQLPASAVKNIKIVNNPNAKYDAEGEGGVINIELKKGEEKGTNGKAEFTLGTRYRLSSSLRLNHRGEKFNAYGGYSYRQFPSVGYSISRRETYDDNRLLRQRSNRSRDDSEHTINFGGDYYFGKSKLSYEGALNFEVESDTENNNTTLRNLGSGEEILSYLRQNTETEDNYSHDNALIYERLFENSDREFRAVVSHSERDQLENQRIGIYREVLSPQGEPQGRERATNDELSKTTVLQADYVHPMPNGKIEAGYKSTFRYFDNDYDYEILNGNTWVNQDGVSNRFLYKDQIHALYFIYAHNFENFDVSFGTRAEQTFVDTRLYDTDETNDQQYLNFFPSLQTQYRFDKFNSLKFTYSRRIDRPNSWRLNPFPDIADSLNIRIGNPNLQPEFIHSFEVGHMIQWEKVDLTSNLFYRHVNGQVDYIVNIIDGISYRQPTNLNTSTTYGLEIINTTELFSWWSLNASYSLFQTQVDGTNLDDSFSNQGLAWNAKLTTDFSLPWDIDMQLTGNYTAPEIEAQGRDLARYYIDMSLQRKFLDDKGTINISFRDIFDVRNFAGENYGTNFVQTFEYKRESQIVLVSLGYNF